MPLVEYDNSDSESESDEEVSSNAGTTILVKNTNVVVNNDENLNNKGKYFDTFFQHIFFVQIFTFIMY